MLRRLLKDKRGIEGLPMRLIIIVVVAAVVLAAILAMMKYVTPTGTLQVSYEFVSGSVSGGTVTGSGSVIMVDVNGMQALDDINFKIKVKVVDANGNPVSGATVILSGAGTAAAGETLGDGEITIEVKNAELAENQETAYMKVEVKASGYNKYVDEEGITIQRI